MKSLVIALLRVALAGTLVVMCSSCAVFQKDEEYTKASPGLQEEINRLVSDLEFQHSEELLHADQRLVYIGEPAIPALLKALESKDGKTRSNAAYVLGEIRDRRVVPHLKPLLSDDDLAVRYESATSLLVLGDWDSAVPFLIQGLRDTDKWNRFKAFSALKNASRQDFGYEWQSSDAALREEGVRRFESWWSAGGHVARATP
ncbi:MAG: HEAT repeat domain-containing protein [Planctomycetes bacterium]|nr:HEAT repeat domain-containing protein [Planctomycetota bacterium]MBI3844442.1 HEAT repeat domain-containing protein [Planctomycetota bacterium]